MCVAENSPMNYCLGTAVADIHFFCSVWTIQRESVPSHSGFLGVMRDSTLHQHHDGSAEIETLSVLTERQCEGLASCTTGEHDHNMGRDVEDFPIEVLSR